MALIIRLRQQGRTNRHTFRLVVTDSKEPRDGKYIEMLGWYDPLKADGDAFVNGERASYWLSKGAELSENARNIIARTAPEVIKELRVKKEQQKAKQVAKRKEKKSAK